MPDGVRPPWSLQRPLGIALIWQGVPSFFFAPHLVIGLVHRHRVMLLVVVVNCLLIFPSSML
jgi:hypothetical protein